MGAIARTHLGMVCSARLNTYLPQVVTPAPVSCCGACRRPSSVDVVGRGPAMALRAGFLRGRGLGRSPLARRTPV